MNQIQLLSILAEAEEKKEPPFGIFWYLGIVLVVIFVLLTLAKNGYKEKVFKNVWSQRAEQLYLFLENFAVNIIGPHGRKYMPMMSTFWLLIFFSNFIGLVLPETPTANLSMNLGLAICAVLYVQWEGIKANGVFGHLSHFAGPKMAGALVAVSGLLFVIEILSEAMKLVSLSLRLYGNIHFGHEVVLNLNKLATVHREGGDWVFPVGGLLLPIKLLTCLVQAMVFTLLFAVYLSLVTHHEEGHDHAEPAHA